MITYDVFKKKHCYMQGDHVVVDGESYPITSIKETQNYRTRMIFVLIIMLLLTVFLFYAGYMGIQDDIINNNNSTDRMVMALFWFLPFGLVASLWWVGVKYGFKDCSNCRSFWIINGKGVYIEQNDDVGIEQQFKEIGLKLRNYGNGATNTASLVKPHDRVKGWFVFVVSGFFSAFSPSALVII